MLPRIYERAPSPNSYGQKINHPIHKQLRKPLIPISITYQTNIYPISSLCEFQTHRRVRICLLLKVSGYNISIRNRFLTIRLVSRYGLWIVLAVAYKIKQSFRLFGSPSSKASANSWVAVCCPNRFHCNRHVHPERKQTGFPMSLEPGCDSVAVLFVIQKQIQLQFSPFLE